MSDAKPAVTILLPVRNEEMNLRVMLRILRTVLEFPHEVLVIHDTADDRSIPVVTEAQPNYPGLSLVHNQLGRGVINAVRAGVAAAHSDSHRITGLADAASMKEHRCHADTVNVNAANAVYMRSDRDLSSTEAPIARISTAASSADTACTSTSAVCHAVGRLG